MSSVLLENWFNGVFVKTIKDYQRLSKTIKDYQRLSKTIVWVAANRFVALFHAIFGSLSFGTDVF
jgi:hypothetical protein